MFLELRLMISYYYLLDLNVYLWHKDLDLILKAAIKAALRWRTPPALKAEAIRRRENSLMVNMNPDTWKAPPTVKAFHISFSISLAAMVTISAVSQQHIKPTIPHRPPIPPRSHVRAQKHHTRTCARTHFLFAPSLSRCLSHIPTVLPPSSTPSRAFPPHPPTRRSQAGWESRISSGVSPAFLFRSGKEDEEQRRWDRLWYTEPALMVSPIFPL